MSNKFEFSEKIILTILLATFVVRLTIPLLNKFNHYISYIQILLFLLFLISKLDFKSITEYSLKRLNTIEFFLFISFIIFLFTVFIVNASTSINLSTLSKVSSYFIIVISFFIYLPKILYLNDVKFIKFTDIVFYISIAIILIGLGFFILGINPIREYSRTTTGIFAHPNTTSMFFTIVIPVIIYKYFSGRISLIFFLIVLSLALVSVLFTFSRAGYIGVGIGLLIYTFNKSKKLFFIIAILLALVGSTIVLEFATMKTDSSITRLLLIHTSISMITENQTSLLWGYGPVNAFDIFQAEKFFFGDEDVLDPHNVFLLLGIQFGMVFTFFITLSFFLIIFSAIKLRFQKIISPDDHRFNLSFTVVIALFFQNMLEDMIIYPEFFFMPVFLIFSGILFYYYKFKGLSPGNLT